MPGVPAVRQVSPPAGAEVVVRRNPFDAAYRKGWDAAHAGESLESCPYRDKRKYDGRLTFSRAWRERWRSGWKAGKDSMAGLPAWKPWESEEGPA